MQTHNLHGVMKSVQISYTCLPFNLIMPCPMHEGCLLMRTHVQSQDGQDRCELSPGLSRGAAWKRSSTTKATSPV